MTAEAKAKWSVAISEARAAAREDPEQLVVIDDHEGKVIRLTSRSTILMTLDGNHLRIPNTIVFKAVILNYTRNPERRFEFDLGVDAADDPVAAMQLGLDRLKSMPFVQQQTHWINESKHVGLTRHKGIFLMFHVFVENRIHPII